MDVDQRLLCQPQFGGRWFRHPDRDLEAVSICNLNGVGRRRPLVGEQGTHSLSCKRVEPVCYGDESVIGILREVYTVKPAESRE